MSEEKNRRVEDLEEELQQVRRASVESDARELQLQRDLLALQEKVEQDARNAGREFERRLNESREELRRELGRAHDRELATHRILQESLTERILEKDTVIAELRAQVGGLAIGTEARDNAGAGSGRDGGRSMKLPSLPTFDLKDKMEAGAYNRWLAKLEKYAELQRWSARDKLLQFELHLAGKAEGVYAVLPSEDKESFERASKALGERVQPAMREALSSAQLLRRRQRTAEDVDNFVREFELLFEESYGHRTDVDEVFKGVLKRDLFVQGLLLKWQEKVLPSAKTFADALHQARTAEEQEKQLSEMHRKPTPVKKEASDSDVSARPPRNDKPPGAGCGQPPTQSRDRFTVICHRCRGVGHMVKDCPMRRRSEATGGSGGGGGSGGTAAGSSSNVTAEAARDECQRLQQEWVAAEFGRLGDIYANEGCVDAVSGALGPLFTAAITISGTPVEALVDPGSSATIMSFDLFKKVGKAAGIPRDALKLPEVTLKDYSRRPIPIFAVVELEFEWQGNKMSAPVYLKSEQGSGMVSEPCLLGTNVVILLELMIPGPGVTVREPGVGQTGMVRLVRADRVPSRCGVLVEAVVEVCSGDVFVSSLPGGHGIEVEPMVLRPDGDGKVSLVVTNPTLTLSAVSMDSGQPLGVACGCEEYACEGQAVDSMQSIVNNVRCEDIVYDPEVERGRREKLAGQLGLDDDSVELREIVLGSHDVFAVEESERGEVRDVCHKVETGDSPPVRQAVRRVPFALRERMGEMVSEMLSGGVIYRGICQSMGKPNSLGEEEEWGPEVLCRLPQIE